jgi:hypothetical protein
MGRFLVRRISASMEASGTGIIGVSGDRAAASWKSPFAPGFESSKISGHFRPQLLDDRKR